ncbi:MAG: hypothetical protein QXQ87_06860 [Halobacteria archaeon]
MESDAERAVFQRGRKIKLNLTAIYVLAFLLSAFLHQAGGSGWVAFIVFALAGFVAHEGFHILAARTKGFKMKDLRFEFSLAQLALIGRPKDGREFDNWIVASGLLSTPFFIYAQGQVSPVPWALALGSTLSLIPASVDLAVLIERKKRR